MEELKKAYAKMQAAKQESDKLDDLWGADPENENLEDEWDAAYRDYSKKAWDLAEMIEAYSHGKVYKNIAMEIIRKKPLELAALIERIA